MFEFWVIYTKTTKQQKDPEVLKTVMLLEKGELPLGEKRSQWIALPSSLFTLDDGVLFLARLQGEIQEKSCCSLAFA